MLNNVKKVTRLDRMRGGRHYIVEGFKEPFPSVTTVLGIINKPALVTWAKNQALVSVKETLLEHIRGAKETETPLTVFTEYGVDQVIEEAQARFDSIKTQAADFGTIAHNLIEQIINGDSVEVPPEVKPVIDNFISWREQSGLELSITETMLYSTKYQYAGAMDALAYRDGKMVALDWKTSNGLYSEYALQVAAYAKALEEMTGEKVSEAWAVRLGKTKPEFEARQVFDIEGCFTGFRAALHLWKTMRRELF